MDALQRELLARLPLAEAVLLLFSHVLDELFLNRIFEEHRGRCYEDKLTFPDVVYLIRDALILHEGSGRASFQRAQDEQRLPSTLRAVYGKLARMPLAISMALLRDSADKLQRVLPELRRPLPASLAQFVPIVFDGKTIKHVAAQLKCLRKRRGRMNSGKMLVALNLLTGLALALQPSANSEANDVSLVKDLLRQLGPSLGQIRLFIADRQFCDLPRLAAFSADLAHFLIRHNRNIHFHPDPTRAAPEGRDARGRRFVQQWGWLGGVEQPLRRYVRRITLYRPGEEDVAVVTDLLDEQLYPAEDLLAAYLERWGIEQMFQQVTEVFDLKNLIGSLPEATLFQGSFCLVLYNLIQVVRAYVAQAGGKAVEEVSTEKLFVDCQMQLVGWAVIGEVEATVEQFSVPLSPKQVKGHLQKLLGGLWYDRWLKSPAQEKHGQSKRTVFPSKGYTNVWKVLQAHQEAQRKARRKAKQQT